MPSQRPLGVFDSGVGGLTVAREVFVQLPEEDVVYFGDTAHVPYGGRSPEELTAFADAISSFLLQQGAKLIIDACNSTSSVALPYLRAKYPVPFVGVVEPGVRAALRCTRNGRIGLIATEATVGSGAHQRLAGALRPEVSVFAVACPRLVPLAEEGAVDTPEAYAALQEYLAPLQAQRIDTLILGCTHYPFFAPLIRRILGPAVVLVDPAQETVRETARILGARNLRAPVGRKAHSRYFVSGDPASFRRAAEKLLRWNLASVKQVTLPQAGPGDLHCAKPCPTANPGPTVEAVNDGIARAWVLGTLSHTRRRLFRLPRR
ncbi:MAG: glutamate racemase [Clostridia bacterium]|nr:glutamate racemase [Clostridia bacterium]